MFNKLMNSLHRIALLTCFVSALSACVNSADGVTTTATTVAANTPTLSTFKQTPPKSTDPNRAGFDDNGLVYPMPPGYDSKGVYYEKNGNIRDVLPHMQPADYVWVNPIQKRDMQFVPKPTLLVLDEPTKTEIDAAITRTKDPLLHHVGGYIKRPISQTASFEATKKLLTWQNTPNEKMIATINIISKSADTVRMKVLIANLPSSAILRFYTTSETNAYVIPAKQILQDMSKRIAEKIAMETLNGRVVYTLYGGNYLNADKKTKLDNITLEIELPKNTNPDEVEFAIPEIGHSFFLSERSADSFTDSRAQGILVGGTGGSLACHIDVNCQNPRPRPSNDVVKLVFGLGSSCSGTLIADMSNSFTPYVLTAAHCIRTQEVADTLTTFWFRRSSSCNAGDTVEVSGPSGAKLVVVNEATDTALLLLRSPPPAGVTYVGWASSLTLSSWGEEVFGIHHPKGDPQKISIGTVNGYFNLTGPAGLYSNENILSFSLTNISNIVGTSLLTEPGSSGSGLFKNLYFSHPQLVGVLSLAQQPATCNAANNAYYGRFDAAFSALKPWLAPGYSPAKEMSTVYPDPVF
jgi:lysyl endopeptidase